MISIHGSNRRGLSGFVGKFGQQCGHYFGASIGLALKKGLSDRIASTGDGTLALCVLYIGVSGILKGENILITIPIDGVWDFGRMDRSG